MNFSNKICLLCLEKHDNSLEIYGKQGIDLNVGGILQEHFWFEVGTFAAKNICENCWKKVESFHIFYNFVKSIHQRQLCETKAIIDNGSSIKEEPIDIKEVFDFFTGYADTADSPASSDGWIEVDSDTTIGTAIIAHNSRNSNSTILVSSNTTDSPFPTCDDLKVDTGTTKEPANVDYTTGNCKRTILASSDPTDSPAPRSDELEVDDCLTKGPATIEHKTRIYKRKRPASPVINKVDHTPLLSQYFNMACDLCDTLLSSHRDAMKHYRDFHDIKKGYLICCKRKYTNLKHMLSHCEWHVNPDAFKCDLCSKPFRDKSRLRKHFQILHTEKMFNCNDCNQKFSLPDLRKHQRVYHRQSLQCPICQKCFTGKINLRHHIRDVHSLEDEREFRNNKRLLMKVDQENEEAKQFECDICGSRFMHFSFLRNHIKRAHVHHVDRNDHICEICAKSFSSGPTYKFHYINAHTNELTKLQCDICGKWFQTKCGIYNHMQRMHNSETTKSKTCKICGRVASNREALQRHIIRFHREASLECIACGKKFKTKKVLKEHMAIHAGITDLYTCTFCPKTFRSNANMYSHRKRAHPDELEEMKRKKET